MFSRIDEIIYPPRCEVIEFLDPQRFVYPIFKNGSNSLKEFAQDQNYKIFVNEQLKNIDTIDILLRNPTERYLSGVKTFVNNTKRDNPQLDIDTILYFAENYLFLNRHYAPQLSWLINLNRYTTAKLRFFGMESLLDYTPLNIRPTEYMYFDDDVKQRLSNNIHNEMYVRLDNLLLDLIGQELTFSEVLAYLEFKDKIAFQKLKCIVLD